MCVCLRGKTSEKRGQFDLRCVDNLVEWVVCPINTFYAVLVCVCGTRRVSKSMIGRMSSAKMAGTSMVALLFGWSISGGRCGPCVVVVDFDVLAASAKLTLGLRALWAKLKRSVAVACCFWRISCFRFTSSM